MRDVIIVGGGPAGLNAALILGRCRRDVLLCDAGSPRNAVTRRTWASSPATARRPSSCAPRRRRISRATTPWSAARSGSSRRSARRQASPSPWRTAPGRRPQAHHRHRPAPGPPLRRGLRPLLGARRAFLPLLRRLRVPDRPLVAYAYGPAAKGIALELTVWSRDVTLCTDAQETAFSDRDRARLDRHGITVVETAIARLEGDGERAERLVFADGASRPCHAVFLMPVPCDPSDLIAQLGCDLTDKGVVPTGDYETTNVPGLFVAVMPPAGAVRRGGGRRGSHGGFCRQHRTPARGRGLSGRCGAVRSALDFRRTRAGLERSRR